MAGSTNGVLRRKSSHMCGFQVSTKDKMREEAAVAVCTAFPTEAAIEVKPRLLKDFYLLIAAIHSNILYIWIALTLFKLQKNLQGTFSYLAQNVILKEPAGVGHF